MARAHPRSRGENISEAVASFVDTAHPRSRGENDARQVFFNPFRGSSPLTRGKPLGAALRQFTLGLIPAHAGKTTWGRAPRSACRAHPRSRGENSSSALNTGLSLGSSPLTRGKPARPRRSATAAGLIPAHAGKTRSSARPSQSAWAHPRSRGENSTRALACATPPGSSPLTRGKRGRGDPVFGDAGLIPAHAGKTWSCRSRSACPWAHPRSRGENNVVVRFAHNAQGSSPLTRGKQLAGHVARVGGGLIPAHAGKTRCQSVLRCAHWAHPRSRGEN